MLVQLGSFSRGALQKIFCVGSGYDIGLEFNIIILDMFKGVISAPLGGSVSIAGYPYYGEFLQYYCWPLTMRLPGTTTFIST